MIRATFTLILTAILTACTTSAMPQNASPAPAAAIADLAPKGRLRAVINFGNSILATRDATTGRAHGACYLAGFVEEMKTTGFVASALEKHNIEGAAIAP